MDSMNVFEMNNNNLVDNAVDPSMLFISNYNIYDVINNHNNVINVNVNNNFNDTFIYDDHFYYDDDFNGDDNNEVENDESPDVDGANNNTSNNNIKNRNHLKNTKLSKKRRSLNHLHVKFHEVDDSIDNYHRNIINVSNTCSGNNDNIANIGNNDNYSCDNNANITAGVAIDHDTSTITSSTPTAISTTTATSTVTTTNPTSNTPTTTISTTTATTNDDDTSYMMSTATTVSTTTANDDEISSYMYHGRLWTEEMDQELSSLHSTYKLEKDWAQKITNLINLKFHTTLTSSQISKRWIQYLRPELLKRKVGLWSETEIKQLHELVFINSYESRNIKGMIVVHWENVALALNRRYNDCQNKWNTIKKSTLKVGRFTEDEDRIITKTVIEWDAKGIRQGLWSCLESILGRRNDVIRNRWKHVLSKQCWNDSSNNNMFCKIVMDVSNNENNNNNSSSSSSSSRKRSKFI